MTTPGNGVSPLVYPVTTQVTGPVSMRQPNGGMVTFINLDSSAVVYLAMTQGFAAGSANSIPLAPGDSITLSTEQAWYAVATANMNLLIMPGGASYAPGTLQISGPVTANIAGTVDVSITGANTIDVAGNVDVVGTGGTFPIGANTLLSSNIAGLNVPANTQVNVNVGDCESYTAFNFALGAWCTAQANAGAPLTVQIVFNWFADAGMTQLVDVEAGWGWVTNAANNFQNLYAKGNMQGRYLQIAFFNPSTTEPLTVAYYLYGTGRTLPISSWWQEAPLGGTMNSGNGMLFGAGLGPAQNVADNCLSNINGVAVAANQTLWCPLPLKSPGLSSWYFQTLVALQNNFCLNVATNLVNGQVVAGTAGNYAYWNPGNTAATPYNTQIACPRAPLWFCIHTTATPTTFELEAIATDI